MSILMIHLSDFELGLELDSCEVRGILIFEGMCISVMFSATLANIEIVGQEWGRVVFDFLN